MTISVATDAGPLAVDLADRFVVVVTGADDPGAVMAGLAAARPLLRALGASLVSPVVLSPDGPLVRVVGLEADLDVVETVPDLVAGALDDAGVLDATVEVREPVGPLDALDVTPRAVVLRAFPAPAGSEGVLPPAWLEVAAEWVLGGIGPRETVALRLLGAPFALRAADAPATLHAAAAAGTWCDLVQGDLRDRIRTASLTFGSAPHLALAAGGPQCDLPALVARFELLRDVATDLGPEAAYVCVDLEATFHGVGTGVPGTGWPAHGGAPPNDVAGQVVDLVVPDVHPFQVLGAGHVARLSPRPRRRGPGTPLSDGRLAVTLGDPVDWAPEFAAREAAVRRARKELQDLLVTPEQLEQLLTERGPRIDHGVRRHRAVVAPQGPDLESVTLDAIPHARRGLRLTILELAAWVGGEPHSDAPAGVSPVLSAYVRWLAAGLDDRRRQALKPYATRLVGTRDRGLRRGSWRPLAPADELRAWDAADWLARVQAPAWLRAAGLERVAGQLERTRPRRAQQHLRDLVPLLGTALGQLRALDRRVGESTWDAWERASEAAGWVAASEAAWTGVPDVLASATEVCAQELAREPHQGASSLDDTVRAAAIAAVAEAAWRNAGRAAAGALDAAADDAPGSVVTVSLDTAFERAAHGASARLGVDRDVIDKDLELADAAAQLALAEMVRSGALPKAPLELARSAAARSDGRVAWTTVQELVRGVIGDEAWQTCMVAGSTATTRVLHHAGPLVDRAVLVALARETAGLAARIVAATDGAEGLEPVVDALRPRALALLEALLGD